MRQQVIVNSNSVVVSHGALNRKSHARTLSCGFAKCLFWYFGTPVLMRATHSVTVAATGNPKSGAIALSVFRGCKMKVHYAVLSCDVDLSVQRANAGPGSDHHRETTPGPVLRSQMPRLRPT